MTTDRGSLEILANETMRRVGDELKKSMPPGVGFAVLVFDFGERGNIAYASNADRVDMVRALRIFVDRVERGGARSVFEKDPRS